MTTMSIAKTIFIFVTCSPISPGRQVASTATSTDVGTVSKVLANSVPAAAGAIN